MLDVYIAQKAFDAADGSRLVAVSELHLQIKDGEFVCLIGPSGCGKTTTLRIVLGLDRSFSGKIEFARPDGRIGAVFQEPTLLPWRTVEQNVRLSMPPQRRSDDLEELFAILGLAELRGYFPSELSLGLARRAALARAFAVKPDLLLLDEPFVSLDENTAERLRGLLLDVWQKHRVSTLMVTHNLREAIALADRIVFLTDRPARVRGIFNISQPRDQRDATAVAALLVEIANEFPGPL